MKRVLFAISLCLSLNAFASSNKVDTKKVTVINYDTKAGYYVAFKYEDEIGSIARGSVNVGPAIKMQPVPGSKAKPKTMWGAASTKGKGKLVYMGVYKAGTKKPSMFYVGGDEPIYDHKVTPDQSEITFKIYGPQSNGSFKVEW